jgi:hypothetical protein
MCKMVWQSSSVLKLDCLHPFACTRSGSGFPSNVTLTRKQYSVALDGNPEPDSSVLFCFPKRCAFHG